MILICVLSRMNAPRRPGMNFSTWRKKPEPFVRLLTTSRPGLDVEEAFSNLSGIEVVAHESDIRAYAESLTRAAECGGSPLEAQF